MLLGVNDLFFTVGETMAEVRARAAEVFETADGFLAELRRAAPGVHVLLATIPVPNAREGAFEAKYGATKSRDEYRRVQHAWLRLQMDHAAGREAEGVFGLSIFHGLDALDGFPPLDALHPNELGYGQLAQAFLGEVVHALRRRHAP